MFGESLGPQTDLAVAAEGVGGALLALRVSARKQSIALPLLIATHVIGRSKGVNLRMRSQVSQLRSPASQISLLVLVVLQGSTSTSSIQT